MIMVLKIEILKINIYEKTPFHSSLVGNHPNKFQFEIVQRKIYGTLNSLI
jgi:hypothetical protein